MYKPGHKDRYMQRYNCCILHDMIQCILKQLKIILLMKPLESTILFHTVIWIQAVVLLEFTLIAKSLLFSVAIGPTKWIQIFRTTQSAFVTLPLISRCISCMIFVSFK